MSVGSLAARRVAADIWRGVRPADPWRVNGLNNEAAVRRRLHWLANRLLMLPELPEGVASAIERIDAFSDAPRAIALSVAALFDGVNDLSPGWARAVARLLVVQNVAARMGCWQGAAEVADDARCAMRLYRDVPQVPAYPLADLLASARTVHTEGRAAEAIRLWLAADRLHRTPAPLVHVATLMCRARRLHEACWAIRAALLERTDQFPSEHLVHKARRLSRQLTLTLSSQLLDGHGGRLAADASAGHPLSSDALLAADAIAADLDASMLSATAVQPIAVRKRAPSRVRVAPEPRARPDSTAASPQSIAAALMSSAATTAPHQEGPWSHPHGGPITNAGPITRPSSLPALTNSGFDIRS